MGSNENLSETERLIRVETELLALKEAVMDLKKMLLFREENYVTKDVLNEKLKVYDKEIENLKNDKRDSKLSSPFWLQNGIMIFALIISAVSLIALFTGK